MRSILKLTLALIFLTACDGPVPNLHNIKCREIADAVHVNINKDLPLVEVRKICSGQPGCYIPFTGQIYTPSDYHTMYILTHELKHAACKVEA